jgi:TonB family protein
MSEKFLRPALVASLTATLLVAQLKAAQQPARVVPGPNSVAAALHYPAKAKASRRQAALTFYCQVQPNGQAIDIEVPFAGNKKEFAAAVEDALRRGRFKPATIDGQPVSVVTGGTVLFLFHGNHPQIVVSLATADQEKIARLEDYVQPQLIGTATDIRRKISNSGTTLGAMNVAGNSRPSLHAYHSFDVDYPSPGVVSAEVLARVDAGGKVSGVQVRSEFPANSGYGKLLARALEGAKFIPAQANGRPVAGNFLLAMEQSAL